MAGVNRDAAEAALDVLGAEPRFEALRAMVLSLAAQVDAEPGNASLWREYRGALRDLMEASDADGDDFGDLLARLAAGSDSPAA